MVRVGEGGEDHCDATIVGHVFCSFLALVMRQELERGWSRGDMIWNGGTSSWTWITW